MRSQKGKKQSTERTEGGEGLKCYETTYQILSAKFNPRLGLLKTYLQSKFGDQIKTGWLQERTLLGCSQPMPYIHVPICPSIDGHLKNIY